MTSYILCCFCNCSRGSYDDIEYVEPCDDIEYVEPCDLYSNGIYEYQQVQSVYDSDQQEDDIVVSDDISECASSESVAASGCGVTASDGSVSVMDALSHDDVGGCDEVSARHARFDVGTLESEGDDIILAAAESTCSDDESEYKSDNFSETGCTDMNTITPQGAGVRGPQSASVLFPQDCKKVIQVCRGILRLQQCDDEVKSFQIKRLREEALHFIHEEMFNKLILGFLTFLNCIACCNSSV